MQLILPKSPLLAYLRLTGRRSCPTSLDFWTKWLTRLSKDSLPLLTKAQVAAVRTCLPLWEESPFEAETLGLPRLIVDAVERWADCPCAVHASAVRLGAESIPDFYFEDSCDERFHVVFLAHMLATVVGEWSADSLRLTVSVVVDTLCGDPDAPAERDQAWAAVRAAVSRELLRYI